MAPRALLAALVPATLAAACGGEPRRSEADPSVAPVEGDSVAEADLAHLPPGLFLRFTSPPPDWKDSLYAIGSEGRIVVGAGSFVAPGCGGTLEGIPAERGDTVVLTIEAVRDTSTGELPLVADTALDGCEAARTRFRYDAILGGIAPGDHWVRVRHTDEGARETAFDTTLHVTVTDPTESDSTDNG